MRRYKMSGEDKLFRDLQIHLDKQTIGFPATESGSDLRLLKQLFPPNQAKMAMTLTYKYETLEQIYERAKKSDISIEELESGLDETAKRGVIGRRKKDGKKQYRNIPYIVGMGEAGAHNPTPEFIKAAEDYSNDRLFWGAFLSTKVPQMRTIPIEKSIPVQHTIGSYDEIRNLIAATDSFVILECVCRKGAERRGEPCKVTSRKETCMGFGEGAQNAIEIGIGRPISRDEALDIIRKNEEDGLVLQPSNAQGPGFICSCCGCCCGILRLHKAIPNPVNYWATNYYAEVNHDLCTGCGICEERCQTGAMSLDDEKAISTVDLSRCLGCGNCVVACPEEAIELRKKDTEKIPPLTVEDMFEVIMAHK
jgi:electron transport complex protein RnfB